METHLHVRRGSFAIWSNPKTLNPEALSYDNINSIPLPLHRYYYHLYCVVSCLCLFVLLSFLLIIIIEIAEFLKPDAEDIMIMNVISIISITITMNIVSIAIIVAPEG